MSVRARKLVTVDARMLHATGIGTYLSAMLPRVVDRIPEARFCLLGSPGQLRAVLRSEARIEFRQFETEIYTRAEQPRLLAMTPRETRVFWSPHVNVPIVGPGRLLATVHDVFYADPPREARPPLGRRAYLKLSMWALRRRASAVVCPSDFTRRELERLVGPFRCPVHTVPYGVERGEFERPDGARPLAAPYFVYVGNLKPHKNVARTLQAFARVAERGPHDFVVIGVGEDRQRLVDTLDPLVRGRVHFLGRVEREVLRRYVAHASGLVLASLYEGFGLPPVEAMALGVPVLVSRAASLPEVCGDAALYCDPVSVESISHGLEALSSDSGRDMRIARGLRRARDLDWEQTADRTADILAGML